MILIVVIGLVAILLIASLRGQTNESEWTTHLSDDDICILAQQGKKIAAIKAYRTLHGVGLKTAKAAVEKMQQSLD